MAPDVPLFVATDEPLYAVLDQKGRAICPNCAHSSIVKLGKSKNKKIELSLLVHPEWLAGSPKTTSNGEPYGGSPHDDAASTALWDAERASKIRLLEVRGALPDEVTCPETGVTFRTDSAGGTVPKRSHFECASCGTVQDLLASARLFGKAAPLAGYAIQGYSPKASNSGEPYNGRFFAPFDLRLAEQFDSAAREWESRKEGDLAAYWPRSAIPIGAEIGPHDVEGHHFTHWWTMFNPRQMMVHALLLKSIVTSGQYAWETREYVLAAFQQYLRNQNMFCFWNSGADKMEPHYSRNSFHPKLTAIENSVFGSLGRGNWTSCFEGALESADWVKRPWELVSLDQLSRTHPELSAQCSGKSEKAFPFDPSEEEARFRDLPLIWIDTKIIVST